MRRPTPTWRRICTAVTAIVLGWPSVVFAQASATIAGVVRDSAGQPIAGARVELVDSDRGWRHEIVTSEVGQYELPGVPPTPRSELAASGDGFNTSRQAIE